jgi:hypothetical protein
MKGALSSSETLVLTRATRRNIPEDTIRHHLWNMYCWENFARISQYMAMCLAELVRVIYNLGLFYWTCPNTQVYLLSETSVLLFTNAYWGHGKGDEESSASRTIDHRVIQLTACYIVPGKHLLETWTFKQRRRLRPVSCLPVQVFALSLQRRVLRIHIIWRISSSGI